MSQNISVIEVGAYSHIFALLLGFLDIKTLVVTDLDYAKINSNKRAIKCEYAEATTTSNASIRFFTKKEDLKELLTLSQGSMLYKYNEGDSKWQENSEGKLRLIFQKEENGYQPRSFEDAFLNENIEFILAYKDDFLGLKNRSRIEALDKQYDKIADECIDSKTAFALDILLHGGSNNEKWKIPSYIKEGLEWLAK